MQRARNDPRTIALRENILDAIRKTVELWSTDATISYVSTHLTARALRVSFNATLAGVERAIQGHNFVTHGCYAVVTISGAAARAHLSCCPEAIDCSMAKSCDHAYSAAESAISASNHVQSGPYLGIPQHRVECLDVSTSDIFSILQ